MTQAVIDPLEIVDIQQHQAEMRALFLCVARHVFKPRLPQGTVGKPRHGIMSRRPADPLFDIMFLCYIQERYDDAQRPSLVGQRRPPPALDNAQCTVVGALNA